MVGANFLKRLKVKGMLFQQPGVVGSQSWCICQERLGYVSFFPYIQPELLAEIFYWQRNGWHISLHISLHPGTQGFGTTWRCTSNDWPPACLWLWCHARVHRSPTLRRDDPIHSHSAMISNILRSGKTLLYFNGYCHLYVWSYFDSLCNVTQLAGSHQPTLDVSFIGSLIHRYYWTGTVWHHLQETRWLVETWL